MDKKTLPDTPQEKTVSRFCIPTPKWREFLYLLTRPLTSLVGGISFRFGRPYRGTDAHVAEILKLAKPGMVVVSHNNFEFSNLFIDGYWDHAAFVISEDGDIIEAVEPKARICNLRKFIKEHDYVLLLDPCFATKHRMETAAEFSRKLEGKPYDRDFTFKLKNNVAVYCSEVIWWAYEMTYAYVGEYSPFIPRKILGQYTLLPQDFVNSPTLWKPIWTNSDRLTLKSLADPQT